MAELPEITKCLLGNTLLSDAHACDTLSFGDNGRSPVDVGSRVRRPKKFRHLFGNK